MAYANNVLGDDEFNFLMQPKNFLEVNTPRKVFPLEGMSADNCKKNFLFYPDDLKILYETL